MTLMKFILQKRGRIICRVFQNVDIPIDPVTKALQFYVELLFDDLQNLHGASLDTDTTGDALGSRIAFLQNHNLHRADFHALTAGNALLLVDHVDTGLGILGNSFVFAHLHALTALDADIGLCSVALCYDADAGKIFVKFLIEGFGTSLNTLQASHTSFIFLNSELLHVRILLFIVIGIIISINS